jgi:hypothetical protein
MFKKKKVEPEKDPKAKKKSKAILELEQIELEKEEMQKESDARMKMSRVEHQEQQEQESKFNKRDKIFHNDYNTGNVELHSFPDIKINNEYANSYLGDVYNTEDYVDRKFLQEEVYGAFKKSQWKSLPLTKKFSKELMPFIFNDLHSALDNRGFTTTDIVICIAEFMDISYEKVYEIAGLKVKESLIKELESRYNKLSKRKINRLF